MNPVPRGAALDAGPPRSIAPLAPRPVAVPAGRVDVSLAYQPILDVARGIAAGYHAIALPVLDPTSTPLDPVRLTVSTIEAALAAFSTLPTNTFISIPVPLALIDHEQVQRVLARHGDLGGIVLDVTGFESAVAARTEAALDDYRRAGALIAVGGTDTAQPELGSIVRLRPAIIRLGAAWTRDLDQHASRRAAIEVTGQLAGQLDAWILADHVSTAAELRVLAQLGVPLARGPFVGAAHTVWPEIGAGARSALPSARHDSHGALRGLLQQAYTTRDAAAARSVLPDASGFEWVVVLDDSSRPVSILQQGTFGRWESVDALTVNVDTPVAGAVARAMARPASTRFSPVTCTDAAGRFVGILRIESLMQHLVDHSHD